MIYTLIGRIVVRALRYVVRSKVRGNEAKLGAAGVVALVIVAGLLARSNES